MQILEINIEYFCKVSPECRANGIGEFEHIIRIIQGSLDKGIE
jgi:hypothetical protein